MKISTYEKKNIIGPYLKLARIQNSLTQLQFTIKLKSLGLHIDRASISKIESQKRIVTDYELLYFSKALGLPIEALFSIQN